MEISFLYFKECPHAEEALNLLRHVIKEKDIKAKIRTIEIKSKEDAVKNHFLGSPTIQINGLDIEKERRNDPPVFGCRVYKNKEGYSGIPPRDLIVSAIKEIEKQKVLFICMHNSARSQMAEGFLRAFYGHRYDAYSAGIQPTEVNPYAIKVMDELGIDISNHRSKSIEEFHGTIFDYVVSVCDTSKETCPLFPGGKIYLHKRFIDPSNYVGTEEEKLRVFRIVRDEIKDWIHKTFGEGY